MLIWDSDKTIQDQLQLTELKDFYDSAPSNLSKYSFLSLFISYSFLYSFLIHFIIVMIGALELKKGELRVLYVNNAVATFYGLKEKIPPYTPLKGLRASDSDEFLNLYKSICIVLIYYFILYYYFFYVYIIIVSFLFIIIIVGVKGV